MTTIRTLVQNRRIEVAAPDEIPDGTEVTLTIAKNTDDGPLAPAEISRLLLTMEQLEPWDIPAAVVSDLEDWERKINDRGIERSDHSSAIA